MTTTPDTVVVPVEPTEAMLDAMRDAFFERTGLGAQKAYRAMLAARPAATPGGEREAVKVILEPLVRCIAAASSFTDVERALYLDTKIDAIFAALSRPAQASDYHAERIAEVMEESGGFWKACSGCQESVDGYVSQTDYPYNKAFKCQPGGGCDECGGLGVLWDNIDYGQMAEEMLADMEAEEATPTPQPAAARGGEVTAEMIEAFRDWYALDRGRPILKGKARKIVGRILAAPALSAKGGS